MSTPSSDSAESSIDVAITEAMRQEEEKLELDTKKKEQEKIAQLKQKVRPRGASSLTRFVFLT